MDEERKAGAATDEEALGAIPGDFGRYLRQERELRGLARGEVARLTKLAPLVIEALESGDAARMPPRAYAVGYLRSYANAVGLDPDDVVLRWEEVARPLEAPPSKRRSARPKLAGIVVALAAAAAIAAGLWALGRHDRGARPRERSGPVERAVDSEAATPGPSRSP